MNRTVVVRVIVFVAIIAAILVAVRMYKGTSATVAAPATK